MSDGEVLSQGRVLPLYVSRVRQSDTQAHKGWLWEGHLAQDDRDLAVGTLWGGDGGGPEGEEGRGAVEDVRPVPGNRTAG